MRIKQILKQLLQNDFIKNVSILASGSIIGQIVVVVASPLLTRLYSVESFGTLSVFTSVCTILALFSTGRYELAIVLPESYKKAVQILKLIVYIATVVSLCYLLLIFLLRDLIEVQDPTGFLYIPVVYLAPVYIFIIAVLSALIYWNQRSKTYKRISSANALHSIMNTGISLLLGLFALQTGMIWALVGSVVVVVLYYLLSEKKLIAHVCQGEGDELCKVAKEYNAFPKYMIFSDLSLNANQQLTPLMFSTLYNSTIVGHYSLANRMLRLPNILITSSIANVFRNDAIDQIRAYNNCKDLYVSTFKKLFLISFPVYLTIFIFSPIIFKIIFGSDWSIAGDFGRIISLYLFVEFIATPLNTLFYIREQQKKLMIVQTVNLMFSIIMIVIGATVFKDPKISLILYSVNAVCFNLFLIIKSYKLSNLEIS